MCWVLLGFDWSQQPAIVFLRTKRCKYKMLSISIHFNPFLSSVFCASIRMPLGGCLQPLVFDDAVVARPQQLWRTILKIQNRISNKEIISPVRAHRFSFLRFILRSFFSTKQMKWKNNNQIHMKMKKRNGRKEVERKEIWYLFHIIILFPFFHSDSNATTTTAATLVRHTQRMESRARKSAAPNTGTAIECGFDGRSRARTSSFHHIIPEAYTNGVLYSDFRFVFSPLARARVSFRFSIFALMMIIALDASMLLAHNHRATATTASLWIPLFPSSLGSLRIPYQQLFISQKWVNFYSRRTNRNNNK